MASELELGIHLQPVVILLRTQIAISLVQKIGKTNFPLFVHRDECPENMALVVGSTTGEIRIG